jgi:hypothetical protein
MDTYEMTAQEAAVFADYERAARDIQQQAQGALCMVLRSHGLDGQWSREGNTLTRVK